LTLGQKLSQDRADKVYKALLGFSTSQKLKLDNKQIKPQGLGILEPVFPRPKNADEMAQNRRVEFSIYSIKTKVGPSAENIVYDP